MTRPTNLSRLPLINAALLAGVVISGSLLAGAHIFEALGYAPCDLCLDQREAHWTGLFVSMLGLGISLFFKAPRVAMAAVGTAARIYGFGTGLAFYHTGVEFGFWPGPATCSGREMMTDLSEIGAALNSTKPRVPCDQIPWSMFGISMAGYNFLFSGGLFAVMFVSALGAIRRARRSGRLVT